MEKGESVYKNTTIFICTVSVPYKILLTKILKIKLDYWMLGITIGASGARQPVDISINENKLQISKIKQKHTRDTHNDRESNAINITTGIYYAIREV